MKKFLIILSFFIYSQTSFAILEFEDGTFPEFITSARALGMGNAFLSKVDDPGATFYNPAGLGTVRRTTFHLSNFHLELNNGFMSLADGNAFDTFGKIQDNFSAEKIRDNLLNHSGTLSHAKMNLFPNFTTRYFSFGYLYSHSNRATYQGAGTDIEFAERKDHGPVAAFNFSMFGGIFKFGVSATQLNRKEIQRDFTETQVINLSSSDYNFGKGIFVTAGTRITLPYTFLPTISVVARNITSEKFEATKAGSLTPTEIPTTYDAGISITPQIGRKLRMHLELDYRDFTNEYTTRARKRKLNAGIEFDFARKYFFRLGYGDAYGTAGIGIQTQRFMFDFTTYAVDVGANQKYIRQREDRRFVFSLSSGI